MLGRACPKHVGCFIFAPSNPMRVARAGSSQWATIQSITMYIACLATENTEAAT